ncbi:MAG: TetR/AcrR family transcriptional regulator [Maritimibacter sp.]
MQENKREQKKALIVAAAYDLIETRGYAGTSMLAIAKAAKASNETLYNWYGDKVGLFSALVAQNAKDVEAVLLAAQTQRANPAMALSEVGAALLDMLLGARAIALNRAAAADETGTLGGALALEGRARIAPLVQDLIDSAVAAKALSGDAPEIVETFFALLIADQQVRRVTGAMAAPTPAENAARARRAVTQLERLFPPKK